MFVKKDWVSILDNQNGSYFANQSVVDTSQLSNSNKYMSYREAYLAIPLMLTLMSEKTVGVMAAADAPTSADMAIGLKNWFGQIIHSLTLDYNGTTIIQQTQYINMWNSFKLMTSLSWGDVATSGATMGFYPDDPLAWTFQTSASSDGIGVCNNVNAPICGLSASSVSGAFADFASGTGNIGFLKRQQYICYDANGVVGTGTTLANALTSASASTLWKSYVINKRSSGAAQEGLLQIAIMATVHLKHLHSFFQQVPLLKGVFMKMTMALNNTSCVLTRGAGLAGTQTIVSVSNAVGGVNPIMVASTRNTGGLEVAAETVTLATFTAGAGATQVLTGIDFRIQPGWLMTTGTGGAITASPVLSVTYDYVNTRMSVVLPASVSTSAGNYIFRPPGVPNALAPLIASGGYGTGTIGGTITCDLSVGAKPLSAAVSAAANVSTGGYTNVLLYVPAYTFNPTFESAYLSSPVKKIKYTDVYQYPVQSVAAAGGGGSSFNTLITNGIANIKSVLILPFYASTAAGSGITACPVWQSPFDPAGTGPTSPLCAITNFNVVVSGQNAIYNTQKYSYEQFINQLQGVNAVNGNMTDGLTSSLINFTGFEMEYCYYYVDVSRMLPVEESVPKSVQIIGQNLSARELTLMVFIEYGCEVDIDILTGARV